jgi:hypothetical protein
VIYYREYLCLGLCLQASWSTQLVCNCDESLLWYWKWMVIMT